MRRTLTCVVLCLAVLAAGPALARESKIPAKPDRPVVGNSQPITLEPNLAEAVEDRGARLWSDLIKVDDATFLKPHFQNVNLREGDAIVLRSASGRVIEVITGRGPKDMGSFWGLSAMGDQYHVEFRFRHEYDYRPFFIDQVIVGDVDLFSEPDETTRSVCTPADFEDVVCYQGDAQKWSNVMASVGVMSVGSNPSTGLWCSGSLVSPLNYMMTNQHCIEDQAGCNSSEYVFKFYNTTCGGSTTTADWQSFRCGTTVASSPFISCSQGLSDLDFNLSSVLSGDPATTFGFAEPDDVPLTDGEAIYIIQHPAGRPHEITHGSGADVDVDGTVLRYYDTLDTEGGSSGSPIFRESDGKMIGLHHCGGCATTGVGNRGMLMSDIYPLIAPYLCAPGPDLTPAPHQDLMQVVGNGNSVVEPGETWKFTPRVTNINCSDTDATGVAAGFALNPGAGANISLLDTSASFGTIPFGTTGAASGTVSVELDVTANCGDDVIVDMSGITASNGGPFTGQDAYFQVPIGDVPKDVLFFDDFSMGFPGSWTVLDQGSATGDSWTDTNPAGRDLGLTEPFAIADSDYYPGHDLDESLITPVIDCSSYATVELQYNHVFLYYANSPDELAEVDVRSTGTGGAWTNVVTYTADTSGNVTHDISALAAGHDDVQVRFRYSNTWWEKYWAIDDVYVLGNNGYVCTPYDPGSDGTISGNAFNNPVFGGDASGTLVEVFDNPGGTLAGSASTDVSGAYSVMVPAGTYDVKASRPLFLWSETSLVVSSSTVHTLNDVTLLGGDVDGNDTINITDIATIAAAFGTSDSGADVDGNGTVNITDITGTASNFGASAPVAWP